VIASVSLCVLVICWALWLVLRELNRTVAMLEAEEPQAIPESPKSQCRRHSDLRGIE
jgi:hypothetical protein